MPSAVQKEIIASQPLPTNIHIYHHSEESATGSAALTSLSQTGRANKRGK